MHHGVTFNFVSAKVCSLAIFETCFSCDSDIFIAATEYVLLHKFYRFRIFSLLINAVILLLSCFNTFIFTYIFFLLGVLDLNII